MIRQTKYNFEEIHDRVNAAENMQRAGCDDTAKEILEQLANDLKESCK